MKKHDFRIIIAAFICISTLSGCADLRSKFIRKKDAPTVKRYIPVREYDVRPSMELYATRYIYWKNWHKEVLDVLSDPRETNQKKLIVAIEQKISNLTSMRNMLVDERSERLQEIIERVKEVEDNVRDQTITRGNVTRITRTIKGIGREIQNGFSYRRIAGEIRDEFRSE